MRPDPKTRKEPSESSNSLWQGPSRERMVVSRYFFDDEQEPPCTRLTFARSRKVDSLLTGWPLLKFGPGPVYGSPPASKFKGIMKLCHASHSFRLSSFCTERIADCSPSAQVGQSSRAAGDGRRALGWRWTRAPVSRASGRSGNQR